MGFLGAWLTIAPPVHYEQYSRDLRHLIRYAELTVSVGYRVWGGKYVAHSKFYMQWECHADRFSLYTC